MKKLTRKILILTVIAAIVVTALTFTGINFGNLFKVEAATTEYIVSGDYVYYMYGNSDEEIVIAKYMGEDTDVVVPETIDGYTVYAIGTEAFTDSAENSTVNLRWKNDNLKDIESVVLPDTVSYIYQSAFENCTKLSSIKLPEELYRISERAFYGTALTEINLPENLMSIDEYAFTKTQITELIIPENVEYLFDCSLYCETLEKVFFEGYLKSASSKTFSKIITVNNKNEYINHYPEEISFRHSQAYNIIDYLFNDMEKNEETGFWEPVFYEGDYYKEYNESDVISDSNYDYVITPENEVIILAYIPDYRGSVTVDKINTHLGELPVVEIAPYAFYGCELKSVIISSSVKRIGYAAFKDSKNLTSVTLPDSLRTIESSTFYGCSKLYLGNTGIPQTVTEICSYAFYKCSVGYVHGAENVEKMGTHAFYNNSIYDYNFDSLKEIPPYAFYCSTFGNITFPDGVTEIGEYAFYNSYLDSATLPDSLKSIDDYAFTGCGLTEVSFPENIEYLGAHSFENTRLTSVDIPTTISELNPGVFYKCPLESVYVPSNIKVIHAGAFWNSTGTLREIIISEGVEEIGRIAFSGANVEEFTIPSTIKKLDVEILSGMYIDVLNYNAIDAEINSSGDSSFLGGVYSSLSALNIADGIKKIPDNFACKSYVQSVNLPDSVEYIGDNAFKNCKYLTSIDMPANLKEIGDYAFRECPFTEINLPDGLEKIGDYSFVGCKNLTSLEFPDSLKTIGDTAFGGCEKVTEITLPANAESIGQFAFHSCKGIKHVTIPTNVQSIGEATFFQCYNIETVDIYAISCDVVPVRELDSDALPESPFYDSEILESIVIHDGVKELPPFLYSGLKIIDKISLPDSVTDIGMGAFANSSISGVESFANIESIEEYAFKNCIYLDEIILEDKLLLIGMEAFMGCDWLESVFIPDTVSNIETSVFEGCMKLKSVRMSPNVDYIPRQAFHNCTSLSEFIWESDRKLIGRYAFGNCVKLLDFDFVNVEKLYKNSFTGSGVSVAQLGESQNDAAATLETIEVQSFKDCENLATLGIGGDVSIVKSQAFADCANLETAVIADSVTEIAADAFDGCDKLTIYCSENSYAYSYAQTQGIKVSTFVIAPIPNQTYTGHEIKPKISVSASGDRLAENVDFGVTYANNINVGNADVTVKGKGDFRMFASKAKFTIVTKSISAATIAPIADYPYTGSAVTPDITVTDGIKILSKGTDYTVTYANNVNEGTATAKITGIGNYSGTATTNFRISKEAEEPVEPSFFEKVFSSITSFFEKIIEFLVSIFM